MLSPLSALAIDTVGTFLNAYGLIQMKMAHQESEQAATEGRSSNPWCSGRWVFRGFGLVLLANTIHVLVLPFADMSLLTTTCSISILSSCFLSIKLLGETFVWKYDLTASLLICAGSVLTIIQMNTSTETVYSRELV